MGKWGAAIVGGTVAAVGGLANMAMSSASTADRVDKLSQKIGISREAFQEMDFICSQSGTSIEGMQMGMKTLTAAMTGAANGTQSNIEQFEKLGISVTDSSGNLRSQEEVMFETIAALQNMDNQTEKARLATELFGRSGSELMPLLNGAAGSVEEMRQQAHELGLVLDDELIDNGVVLTDTVDQMKRAFQSLATKVGGALMPILTSVINIILDNMPLIQSMVDRITPVLTALFEQLLPPLMDLAEMLLPIIFDLLETLIPPLMDIMRAILPVITDLLTMLLPPIVQIVQMLLPLLLSLLEPLLPLLQPILALLQPFIDLLVMLLEPLVELLNMILPPLIEIISGLISMFIGVLQPTLEIIADVLGSVLNAAFKAVMPVVQTVWDFISNAWKAIQTVIETVLGVIRTVIDTVWGAIKNTIMTVINAIASVISTVWGAISNTISTVVNTIKNTITNGFTAAKNTVTTIFNAIKNAIMNPIETAKTFVGNMIEKIKGFFKFEWSLPKLKMPHVKIDGSFSLMPPSVPSFSIDWYAKGGIMKDPTIFGFDPTSNSLMGGGEAGPEAIAPISTLQQYVQQAVQAENQALILKFDRLIELLEVFFPDVLKQMKQQIVLDSGALVGELAPAIDNELGWRYKMEGRG